MSIRAPVGPTNLAAERCCIGRGLAALSPRQGVESRFILYAMRHRASDLDRLGTGTTFKAVSGKTVNQFLIAIAPLAEQRRIVAKIEELFSDLDAGVAALARVKANLKQYRAAVLKAAVEGRLTEEWRARNPATEPASVLLERILAERRAKWALLQASKRGPDDDDGHSDSVATYKQPKPPEQVDSLSVPRGWTCASLDQCCLIIDYRGRTPPYSDTGIPHLRSSNVRDGRILWDGLKYVTEHTFARYMTRGLPETGDLLFTTEAPLGAVALAPTDQRFSLAQRLVLLRATGPSVSPTFLMYQIMSSAFQARLGLRQSGSTVTGVSSGNVRPTPVVIPPIAEQAEIVAEVDRRLSVADAAVEEVEHALQRAARLRQAILKRAFEGRLVPQDPTDEPAAAMLERIKADTTLDANSYHAIRGGRSQQITFLLFLKMADEMTNPPHLPRAWC